MKKLQIINVLFLSIVIILSACGTSDSTGTNNKNKSTGNQAVDQDLLKKIKAEGKILIGTEGTYPPFTFHDDNGKLTGFDVELATEIAKRLGVKPEFKETQWDAMFAGLDAKRFDMIANEVGIRPDRQEKYDFSNPYITTAAVLIAHSDNDHVKSFEDIKGLNSAQTMTSNYADLAKKFGAKIVSIEGFNQAVELIVSKRVDVTINDKLSFLDFKKQRPDAAIKIVATSNDASQSGFMFRKNNESIRKEVNNALKKMIDDGTYKKISEKWFGEDVLK